jgi:hypothetical protein
MQVEVYAGLYSEALLRQHPDKLFVFGDNLKRYGKRGQAVIRDVPNAFGVPTKRHPSIAPWAFFSDKDSEKEEVLKVLRKLYMQRLDRVIVFPSAGIGTGLAMMQEKSPHIWEIMNKVLKDHFGFINGA